MVDSAEFIEQYIDKIQSQKDQVSEDLYTYLIDCASKNYLDNPFSERWDQLINKSSLRQKFLFGLNVQAAVVNVPFHELLLPLFCSYAENLPDPFVDIVSAHEVVVSKFADFNCSELSEIARYVLFTDLCEFKNGQFLLTTMGQRRPIYEEYIEHLFDGGWQRIGLSYPVLAYLLLQCMDNLTHNARVFAERFRSDFPEVAHLFGAMDLVEDCKKISDIEFGLSDPHEGGASTIRLEVDQSFNIFYKPKPLANERWFNEDFLPSIQPCGFKKVNVIDSGSHGWAQDANASVPTNASTTLDVGESIAIAFVLNATDLHSENVLISDEGMAWIDLEMLFTPPTAQDHSNRGEEYSGIPAIDSGLVWSSACRDPMKRDPSGLFGSNVFDILPNVRFRSSDQDGVAVDFDKSENQEQSLRTRQALSVGEINPNDIAQNFTEAVSRLRDHQGFSDLLNRAQNGRVRYVFRPTAFYYRLRQKLLQPRFLRSAVARNLELLQLFNECIGLELNDSTMMASIIKSEISQMEAGDIPVFWTDFESTDLNSPLGPIYPSYFALSPKESVVNKLKVLMNQDIDEQANVLQTILEVYQDLSSTSVEQDVSTDSKSIQSTKSFNALLDQITEELLSRAFITSDQVYSWVSFFGAVDGDRLFPRGDIYTPYGGSFGILYFLSCMLDFQDREGLYNDRLTTFFGENRKIFTGSSGGDVFSQALARRPGLDGLGGLFVAASQRTPRCSELFGSLVDIVLHNKVNNIAHLIEQESSKDIINGAAGMAIGLASYLRTHREFIPSSRVHVVESLLVRCIQSILDQSCNIPQSSIWFTSPKSFSHGRLGIAAALVEGYSALETRRERPHNLKNSILSFVRDSIDACGINPKNGSDSEMAELPNISWCHGLAGVGYSYLLLSRLDPGYKDAAGRVATLLKNRPVHSLDCFCCGQAGVAEFLRLYGALAGDSATQKVGEQQISAIASKWHRTGEFSGSWGPTKSTQLPGYFQGASGLGLSILNLLDPSFVNLGMPFCE